MPNRTLLVPLRSNLANTSYSSRNTSVTGVVLVFWCLKRQAWKLYQRSNVFELGEIHNYV
jgi:hypothetical protein